MLLKQIERSKEQIEQLKPINEIAIELSNDELITLNLSKKWRFIGSQKKNQLNCLVGIIKSNIQLVILNDG
jgi:hypothetical protein